MQNRHARACPGLFYLGNVINVGTAWSAPASTVKWSFCYHYGSLARAVWKSHLANGDVVPIKKLLYGLRACSAFLWVGKNQTPPPVPFARLLDFIEIDRPDVGLKCRNVVEVKSGKMEADDIAFDTALKSWMAETMLLTQSVSGSPEYPAPDRLDGILMGVLRPADLLCPDRKLRP